MMQQADHTNRLPLLKELPSDPIETLQYLTPELTADFTPSQKKNVIGWAVAAHNKEIADGERDERERLQAWETLNTICITPEKWTYMFDMENILKYAVMLDMQITIKVNHDKGEPRPTLIISPYKH